MNTGSHFGVKDSRSVPAADPPTPMQERSRATASRFLDAAFELLREKTFAELSVAALARKANRSVGVFYQRFGSKDEFLAVLLRAFFTQSLNWRSTVRVRGGAEDVYRAFLKGGFDNLLRYRNLWHAALERSATDPAFWSAYASIRAQVGDTTRRAIEKALGRDLDPQERRRLALAGQVFNSVINNQIINAPGPLMLEDEDFYPELERIALDIARLP